MSARFVIGAFLLTLATGCTSVAERRDRDRADLGRLVHERTGVELGAQVQDDGRIAAEARTLLASPLTEDSAVKIAVLNNRTVRAELAELGVASAELVQAGLLSNPVLSANAKFFDGGTEIEFGIVESFMDVFFVAARKRVGEAELEATKARIARELVGVVHDVRRAFVRVRAARRLLEVEHEVLRAAEASSELMGELHRAGNVTDPKLTAEEVALAREQLAVAQAEAASAEAREPLNVLLGLWGDDVAWTIEGNLADDAAAGLSLDHVEARAIEASLELAELRAEATAEARRVGIVGWEAVLAPGEIGVTAKKEVGSSEWGVGPALGFSLPVFDTGSPRRAVAEAKLEEALARHIARAVEVRSAARRLRERVIALGAQAAFIRDAQLPKATRLVRETLRNYNAMQIGVFEVFAAKEQEIEAARNYVETLRDAWLARLDLEELLAGGLNDERVAAEPSAHARSTNASNPEGH
ncbi:MAG: TolC family protein [Planctomycetes bacterium]|nr:TolC family protein [Planctomycetota bacterium]